MILTDDVVTLERLGRQHADQFLGAVSASANQIGAWLGDQAAPKTSVDVAAFIEDWRASWDAGVKYGFVATELLTQRCVGFGLINYIHERYRIANLGYWVRPDMAGRGYATRIAGLVARFGFDTLGLVRLELVVEPANAASRRVAEKLGASEEGLLRNRLTINGEVRNALMFGLLPD